MTSTFASCGLFILDEFAYEDENGISIPGKVTQPLQIGGGGVYAAIGARIWLPSEQVGVIVDRGHDFPPSIQSKLEEYGSEMWLFRDQPDHSTTRALNLYRGTTRHFKYLTPRIRLTPRDFQGTRFFRASFLHFVCSPTRASEIMAEVVGVDEWNCTSIYEPIPDRCVPEELPALISVLPMISILSPNDEEALSLLSLPLPPTKSTIEKAAQAFLQLGIGFRGEGSVIIRSGARGAYVATREHGGHWIDAYWRSDEEHNVIDVTGAGNSFLGGLAAGLALNGSNIIDAVFYATVSASFIIEQAGLPSVSRSKEELWNGDSPERRLEALRKRHEH